MEALSVFIAGEYAGRLSRDRERGGKLIFEYDAQYQGVPISLRYPVGVEQPVKWSLEAWWQGVLPDLRDVQKAMDVGEERSTGGMLFNLLAHYGADLPGAIQTVEEGNEESLNRPAELTRATQAEIAAALKVQIGRYADGVFDKDDLLKHWSLGGAQPKLALAYVDGTYYACSGSQPSTVIVKPGIPHLANVLPHQPFAECLTMMTAANLGLNVASCRMEMFDDVDAIVVDRYDRLVTSNNQIRRLHQEDLCQVAGQWPDKKYVSEGGPGPVDIAGYLQECSDGVRSVERFIDSVLFNNLVFAPDCHAKNHAVIHLAPHDYRFAPLYDMASILPYRQSYERKWDMGMRIARAKQPSHVTAWNVTRLAEQVGLDGEKLLERANELAAQLPAAAEKAVNEIADRPYKDELGTAWVAGVEALTQIVAENLTNTSKLIRPQPFHVQIENVLSRSIDTAPTASPDHEEELRVAESVRDVIEGNIFDALNQKPSRPEAVSKRAEADELTRFLTSKRKLK